MAQNPAYIPVLRAREGELAAYERLAPAIRDRLAPLIELPSIPYDFTQARNSRTLEQHLDTLFERTGQALKKNPFYLDFNWLEMANDENARAKVLGMEKLTRLGLTFCIVLTPKDETDTLKQVGKLLRTVERSGAIRLRVGDFNEDSDAAGEVDRMINVAGLQFEETDLIIDLQDIGSDLDRALLVARSIFSQVPSKEKWRRVALIASSFPEDLSEVDAASVQRLPRREWNLWNKLQSKPAVLPRPDLIFGDYAVSNPTQKELDPRTMRMSANIRYTTEDNWLIVKGRNVRRYGFDQYFELCRTLIERPEYRGRDYSEGDKYISDCADGQTGPGNATTWRRVGVNHHLTLMVDQLAELYGALPSKNPAQAH